MSKPATIIEQGTRFGKLVVIARLQSHQRQRNTHYLCACDCGRTSTPTATSLKTGNSKSCGVCYKLEYCVPKSALSRAYRTYRRNAKKKNLRFGLSFSFFIDLANRACHYCGALPVVNSYSQDSKVKIPMNGVDRLDSKIGYTPTNCVPCCTECNLAKLDRSVSEFLEWVGHVHKHSFDFAKESE